MTTRVELTLNEVEYLYSLLTKTGDHMEFTLRGKLKDAERRIYKKVG